MKKAITFSIAFLAVAAICAYIAFQFYLPALMADAIVADDVPTYIPRRIQNRIEGLRKPLNKGSEEVVRKMHQANIPVEKMVEIIDNTTEEQAYALLDELNQQNITSPHQVFDIGKKYFPADFDTEMFRETFVTHMDMRLIRKGIKYGNINRKTKDVDFDIAKAIAKKIILEKEQEYQESSH
jgi:hypothetical protein